MIRTRDFAFLTLGAFPLQEVELSKDDKWLFGGQLGFDWKFAGGSRVRFGVAYYQYENIVGQRNALGSDLLDFTAPQFLQKGNTLFDIRNDVDPSTNLLRSLPIITSRTRRSTSTGHSRRATGSR